MTATAKLQKKKKEIFYEIADFWCGAGGTSTGLMQAVEELGLQDRVRLTAVNHWEIAVETHSRNHKNARHYCKAVDSLSPLELYPQIGNKKPRLRLLIASPECTHHSNARGGKPRDEQKRADANDIMRWVSKLDIDDIFIENVKEFVDWGPLNSRNQPIKRLKGVYFLNFIEFLKHTHNVQWRIVNCANFGDATTRERFFLIARRKSLKKSIVWPAPTHAPKAEIEKMDVQPNFFNPKTAIMPWRPAREIIDWDLKGESIFLTPEDVKAQGLNIKRPLSLNTMKRIVAGLFKYSLRPFLVNNKGTERRDGSVDNPTFTQLTPYLTKYHSGEDGGIDRSYSVDAPLQTLDTSNRFGIVQPQPFITRANGGDGETHVLSTDSPLPTIVATWNKLGLAEAIPSFMTKYHGNEKGAMSVEDPVSTLTTNDRLGLASVSPYIVRMKANQDGQTIEDPLKTLTTMNSYALVIPQLGLALDILFRMLQPHELAAAMSFPKSYSFAGTRADQVRQIGNAVPVKAAKVHTKYLLST